MKAKAFNTMTTIIMAIIFPMLIISLIIYLSGFRGPIQLDQTYYNFLQQVAIRSYEWNIRIPSIPLLNTGANTNGWDVMKALAEFINFFIRITNMAITVVNMVISIFTTIGAMISLLFEYFGNLNRTRGGGDLSYWNNCLYLVL